MKKLFTCCAAVVSAVMYGQTFTQAYKDRSELFLQSNINTTLTEFAALGVKTTGTTANNNAFTWLKNKYISYGYSASEISEHTFTKSNKTSKNLIVTKTGTVYPHQYVIICGHYDTLNGPGVNDNGSGTAIILEIARILENVDSEYSIKFINFSGEEQGLWGSTAYVADVVNATTPKMNIRLVFNLDEVGGVAGQVNNRINCEKDGTPTLPTYMATTYASYPSSNNAASNTFNTILMNCFTLYSKNSSGQTLITPVSSYIERSDYMPFDKNGDVCIGLYETLESTKPHTTADTYTNMDPVFVYNVGKGAIAALQHFAVSSTNVTLGTGTQIKNAKNKISLFPNPVKDFLYVGADAKNFDVIVNDASGKKVLTAKNSQMLNVSALAKGTYFLTATLDGETVTKKFIVTK